MEKFPAHILKSFLSLGLSQKQILVLSKLYELGRTKVYDLYSHIGKVPRTEMYKILAILEKEGLVSKIIVNNVTYFELKESDDLIRWAFKVKCKMEDTCSLLKEATEHLKGFFAVERRHSGLRPKLQCFEGIRGIALAHKSLCSFENKLICGYLALNKLCAFDSNFIKDLLEMVEQNPDCKFRFLVDGDENTIDILQAHPRIICKKVDSSPSAFKSLTLQNFEDDKEIPSAEHLLLYINGAWILNFSLFEGVIRGYQVGFAGMGCTSIFKTVFDTEWAK